MLNDKYNAYINSELNWLAEIPENWSVKRVKEIMIRLDQGWSPNAAPWPATANGYGVLKLSAISNNQFFELKNKELAPDEVSSYVLLAEKGRVLMTRSNTPDLVGEVCFIRKTPYANLVVPDLIFSLLLKPNKVSSSYFAYLINSHSFSYLKTISARGLNDSMVKISQATVKNWKICLPPKDVQQKIANYIEMQLTDVNETIRILEGKIELYENLRQNMIFDCVTKGINHQNTNMTDIESDWLEKIPEGWNMLPVRNVLNNISVKNKNSINNNYLSLVAKIGVIPYAEKGKLGNKKPDNLEKCKVVSCGDLVLNTMNFSIGSFGLSKYNGVCSSVYLVLRANKNCNGNYLYRIFQTKHFQNYVSSFGKGILDIRMAIKWESLKNIEIPIPSEEEQIKIADYIDIKESEINNVIKNIKKQVSCLKELSIAFVDEVTTGMSTFTHKKDIEK